MKIKALTGGEVQMGDLVDGAEVRAPVEALRSVGRPQHPRSTCVERWVRSLGLKAVGLLCAHVPGAPSWRRIRSYMDTDPRPRWVVRGRTRPSVWVGDSAVQVADSYRVVQSLRGNALEIGVEVWRQGEEDQITRF